jgi:hypothetical protein
VDTCGPSLHRLRNALSDDCDAIAVEGSDPGSPDAIKLAREISSAPLVFFEGLATDYNPTEFDLLIRAHFPTRLAAAACSIDRGNSCNSEQIANVAPAKRQHPAGVRGLASTVARGEGTSFKGI